MLINFKFGIIAKRSNTAVNGWVVNKYIGFAIIYMFTVRGHLVSTWRVCSFDCLTVKEL